MTFAAPLFLLAALAGLIPVVLHMIHRQKAKELRFSTLRFLRISVQRTRRRKYIDDMSLLAVRVAVLLLIAVGLARPALSSLAALWGGGRTAAIAIVLDNSASMAVIDAGRPRFETARQAAEQVLARLREGDQVALLPTGGPPGPELGRLFRTTRPCARRSTSAGPATSEPTSPPGSSRPATCWPKSDAPNKEIYVFTDNQSLSWEGLKEPAEGRGRQQAEPCCRAARGPGQRRSRAGAQRGPPDGLARQPGPGRRGTVPGRGRGPQHLDGAPAEAPGAAGRRRPGGGQPDLEPAAGRIAQVRVPVHSRPGGRASGRGPAGRGRWIGPGQPPLLRGDRRSADPAWRSSSLVATRSRRPTTPSTSSERWLPAAPVGGGLPDHDPDARVAGHRRPLAPGRGLLRQPPAPSAPPAAEKLLAYVRAGGHVVWVCGQNVQPVAYNAMNALAQGQLLPAPLEDLRQPLPGRRRELARRLPRQGQPGPRPLTEPASLYQSVLVYKHFPMTWGPQSTGRVLIKLDDGQPLLVERPVGAGSVLLARRRVHVDWTNLPLKPLFLPLLARLTFHLAGAETERTMGLAGAPVSAAAWQEDTAQDQAGEPSRDRPPLR